MELFTDTQAIFQQLAGADRAAVKTLIENHDAWGNSDRMGNALSLAVRARLLKMPRDGVTLARIERQRQALATLVTRLKTRISSAG